MRIWSGTERFFFGAFIFWSVAGLLSTFFLTPGVLVHARATWPAGLTAFVEGCVRHGDPILILLAFANTHLHAARQWSGRAARRWAVLVLPLAWAAETIGAATGFPFGSYHYTHKFGPLLGLVPMTIPLAWHVVVTNALFLFRGLAGVRPVRLEAITVGALVTAYDFVLEPFATRVKGYWLWLGGTIPLQNYAAWFVLGGALVLLAPRLAARRPRDPRPALILGVTLLIFLAGRWAAA